MSVEYSKEILSELADCLKWTTTKRAGINRTVAGHLLGRLTCIHAAWIKDQAISGRNSTFKGVKQAASMGV
jgi:hypothetical protein